MHHLQADGVTEDVVLSGRKPNRFHLKTICSIKSTLGGEGWHLMSSDLCTRPVQAPTSFLNILQLWGNTWQWKHLQVTGGTSWIHVSIADGSLVAVTDGLYIREIYPNHAPPRLSWNAPRGEGKSWEPSWKRYWWQTHTEGNFSDPWPYT